MRRILTIIAAGCLLATGAMAGGWQYDVALYGWLAGLEGTIGVGEVAEQPVEATFNDLLNYVDFAMAGRFEARGEKAVWLADISYTGLGSERDAEVLQQPVTVKMDLDQWIFELGGGYRLAPKFDLLLAGRYYIIETGATFDAVESENEQSGSVSVNWFDVFVGARYHTTFGEKWFGSIRGDVGAGGSEFAWFGQLALGYNLSDRFGLALAWRILSLDYSGDEGESFFRYDVAQSGLGVGLGYRF